MNKNKMKENTKYEGEKNMNNILKRKVDQTMFEEATSFKDFFNVPFFKQESFLKTDVIEKNGSYTLIMDVPGCNKDDVKISNEDGYLTIEVNKTNDSEYNADSYLRKERMHGTYSRSYYIGKDVDASSITATFTNGLLNIFIPKQSNENSITYIPIKEKK